MVHSFTIDIADEMLADLKWRLAAIRWTKIGAGGHFMAMEEPDQFDADFRAFAGGLRAKQ